MPVIPLHILISRTDSIGDVMLTLPMAGMLKKHFPGVKISFLGSTYTRAIAEACIHIDHFVEKEAFLSEGMPEGISRPDAVIHVFPDIRIARKARKMGIPVRIGATGRWYHYSTCNKLVRLTRKRSRLHEAQLNMKLLQPFGMGASVSKQEIEECYGFERIEILRQPYLDLLRPGKYHIVLHPGSKGSAREWKQEYFIQLAQMLDPERFQVFVSGTSGEKAALEGLLQALQGRVTDITGMMELPQFISFLAHCDGIVACSTGPLHIAAALGIDAFGIYPSERPVHPGRWAPIGHHVRIFETLKDHDEGMSSVTPEQIRMALEEKYPPFSTASGQAIID